MTIVKTFTFNPFQVNTYLIYNETKECVIIDAACIDKQEEAELETFITVNNLKPVLLLSTHTHVDHIPGNCFVMEKYKIPYKIHEEGLQFVRSAKGYALGFGFPLENVALPTDYIKDKEIISSGGIQLEVLYTPGHANGSVCFYNKPDNYVIVGDVLFNGSIGRSDFPTGNHEMLIKSINERLFTLPDNTKVYSGHGPATTIGFEKRNNPFFN